jgi:hypothetical protein
MNSPGARKKRLFAKGKHPRRVASKAVEPVILKASSTMAGRSFLDTLRSDSA